MTHLLRLGPLLFSFLLSSPSWAATFKDAVDHLLESERRFDPSAMGSSMCALYVEISPVGDIDYRNEVLSFYKPQDKIPVTLQADILDNGSLGDIQFVVVKLTFDFQAGGKHHKSVLIGSFYGELEGAAYRVCRAQYTNFHAKK